MNYFQTYLILDCELTENPIFAIVIVCIVHNNFEINGFAKLKIIRCRITKYHVVYIIFFKLLTVNVIKTIKVYELCS